MARKQFLVVYPDGSRKHIGTQERDTLLRAFEIQPTAPSTFLYVGQAHTYHSFADLEKFRSHIESKAGPIRRFLEGSFTIEHQGKRRRELLETVDGMICRMVVNKELTAPCVS